jgi:putative flippase GtrA
VQPFFRVGVWVRICHIRCSYGPIVSRSQRSTIANFLSYAVLMVPISLVDIGTAWALIHVGVHYLVAVSLAFLLANLLVYFMSRRLIFKQSGVGSLGEFTVFASIGLVAIGIQDLTVWIAVSLLHLHWLIGKVAAMGITVFWTYFSRRAVVHASRKTRPAVPPACPTPVRHET